MSQEEKDYMSSIPYLSAVGSLMYLAIGTHPDIAFAVGLLSRFNSCPAKVHWNAIQHVFKYLKALLTLDWSLGHQLLGEFLPPYFLTLTMLGTLKRHDSYLDMPLSLVLPALPAQVVITAPR